MNINNLSSSIIIKNTIFLYIRMFLIIFVTFYTSKIILKELGHIDFGLFHLVIGFVVMFSFFGSSISNAAQRFLNYQYASNNFKKANSLNLFFNNSAL